MRRRDFLLGTASTLALARQASAVGVLRGGGAIILANPPLLPTTLVVSNPGPGALAANAYVQFGHGYGAYDLPSGQSLAITDDLGSSVPYTAMARSSAGGTSVRFSDNIVRLPNGIAAPLVVSSITRSGTTATVTTASPHGLSSGAVVHMEGQLPDDYCGQYPITTTGPSSFTYTMPTTPASNATAPGQMNYTRVLTLSAVVWPWNNTLPNGKTAADIIADITANFDNLTLTLQNVTNSAGATVASGTFNADLATALAASPPAGQLRTPASRQGALVCDIVALMKFNDSVTPTTHLGAMAAWFYVTALLDPATGAVQELRSRVYIDNSLANTAMDYMTYRAKLTLGSTVVRSTGLSTNAAIDGTVQSLAPSAVNTSTGLWTIPNHGFQGGETVRLTTTGTLPGGFSASTDYAVIWGDSNTIGLTTNYAHHNQLGDSSKILPSTQGSGTHTITCWLHSAYENRLPYCGDDGLPDRWIGKTGAFSPQSAYPIHNAAYLQKTKMVPPIDLSINLPNKTAFVMSAANGSTITQIASLDRYVFGGCGSLQNDQDTGGAGGFHEYGGPWTDKPCRRLRYCNDRGYAQTLRVDALMMGVWSGWCCINDDTTWRIPVVNNGPNHAGASYFGMPASKPNSYFFSASNAVGFTLPTSGKLQNITGRIASMSHRYILLPRLYLFEGGQDIHDLFVMDANYRLLENAFAGLTYPTTLQLSAKNYSIGGTTYYTWIDGSEPRTDAWSLMVLGDAVAHLDDTAPEKPYLVDQFLDWVKIGNYLIHTVAAANDPDFLNLGGWPLNETMKTGPGNISFQNAENTTGFMQSYIGMTWGHLRRMLSGSLASSDLDGIMNHFYKFVDNLYRVTNGWMGNSYHIRFKRAPGTTVSPDASKCITSVTDPILLDGSIDAIFFRTDGTIVGGNNGGYTPVFPALNDRHEVTDVNDLVLGYYVLPPEIAPYNYYYIRQPSGSYLGWKYAPTNSDATIINAYSAFFSTTLSAAIATAGQTALTTTAVPQFGYSQAGLALPLMFIGNELVKVVGSYIYYFNLVAAGAIVTTNALSTVAINLPAHGLSNGDKVRFHNSSSLGSALTVGGLTLSGADLTVTVVDANNITVAPGGTATSSASSASAAYWNANRFTVTRALYGTTAATYANGATIYTPYKGLFHADYQNRAVPFPPAGHAYRITGAAAISPDGYLTMMRTQAGYGYLNGIIARTAFDNADAWFSDAQAITAGGGPPTFAANNTLKDSVNIALT